MLATPTKAEESAALKILCDAYLAKGGKIHRDLTPAQKRKRRALGMAAFNPRDWEENARTQFAQDDKAYYHMAEARNSLPVYDAAIGHAYGIGDNDRRQTKARIGGQSF